MGDVLQIIGSVFLIVAGVAVIIYVLFRKSPVKTGESENEMQNGAADDADATEDETADEPADDIPEGEAPAEIEPNRK